MSNFQTPFLDLTHPVLITGISPNSVGEATALSISFHNPSLLILASRTAANISAVQATIQGAYPSVQTRALTLDLASPASIRAAAAEILAYPEPAIDILISNAGIMDLRPFRTLTPSGIEQHLAINTLGPFLFTNLLLPKLRSSKSSRIIIVASSATFISPFRFSDPNVEKAANEVPEKEKPNLDMLNYLQIPVEGEYISWVAYGASKTGAVLLARKWAEGLKGEGITVVSLHPGGKF